jgi:hypothetical protein
MTRLSVSGILAAILVAACGRQKISKPDAATLVRASAAFRTTKLAYVPRVVAIPADAMPSGTAAAREGQALTILEIASVDPVVALLRARDQIEIEDFVSAVQSSIVLPPPPAPAADSAETDSTKAKTDTSLAGRGNVNSTTGPPRPKSIAQPQTSPPPTPPLAQQWVHTLRVTPRARPEMADLSPDDGGDDGEGPRPVYTSRRVGRVPGWKLALGTRELLRVLGVAHGDGSEVAVDFLWRWRPTRAGALFDEDGAEFRSLPSEVQQAVAAGALTMDTSIPQWSRATLTRDGTGWRVVRVDWGYGLDKPHDPW